MSFEVVHLKDLQTTIAPRVARVMGEGIRFLVFRYNRPAFAMIPVRDFEKLQECEAAERAREEG